MVIGVGVFTLGGLVLWVLSNLAWEAIKAGAVWGWNAARRWWTAR
jgi:hypothetical protein